MTAAPSPFATMNPKGSDMCAALPLPPAWQAFADNLQRWVPAAVAAEAEALAHVASAAGIDPATVSLVGCGVGRGTAPLVAYFGDWRSGPYVTVTAQGLQHWNQDGTPQ